MRFTFPVGSEAERASGVFPPARWYDATGFAKRYFVGTPKEAFHTGLDLNLAGDADAHTGVYAIANGVVTCCKAFPVWGNIIVIQHGDFFARYAHVEQPLMTVGQSVAQGQQIASVGNASGAQPYHLHFDVSHTRLLYTQPDNWPKLNLALLKANYLDPILFFQAQGLPQESAMGLTNIPLVSKATANLRLRTLPDATAAVVIWAGVEAKIAPGQQVVSFKEIARVSNVYEWAFLQLGSGAVGWAAAKDKDGSVWLADF